LALLAGLASVSAAAEGLEPAVTAVTQTKPLIDLRLRSETVDQTGLARQADALTLRARLGFETGKAWGTSLLAEADLMTPLEERYNSTVNGKTTYPTVVDPENYALNRLQLANTSLPDTTLILGRQRINLDDQRFVGNSGWRQNEQTFDSFRVVNRSIAHLTFDLTYLDRVNRVYGRDSPVGHYTGDTYLANVGYETPFGKLSAFEYLLSFNQAHTDSSQTTGLRFAGEKTLSGVKLAYVTSYAHQHEYAHNPLRYADGYYLAELTGTYRQLSLGGGIETLEGNGVKGFSTPLATFHKFDGWDDKFLTTPVNGLQRKYVTAGWLAQKVGFLDSLGATAVYHDFSSSRLNSHYGSEIDLLLQGRFQRFTGLLKFADYAADRFATSTRKLWLELDYVW
jgi:hypothetical protein